MPVVYVSLSHLMTLHGPPCYVTSVQRALASSCLRNFDVAVEEGFTSFQGQHRCSGGLLPSAKGATTAACL